MRETNFFPNWDKSGIKQSKCKIYNINISYKNKNININISFKSKNKKSDMYLTKLIFSDL